MFLLISNLDQFVFRKAINYYPQVYLEECKHVIKEEKKILTYIISDIGISSDSDREDSDKENSDEKYIDGWNILMMIHFDEKN